MTSLLGPDAPPLPVASAFDTLTGDWIVVFDKDLISGEQSRDGWGIVILNFARQIFPPIVVDGNVVRGTSAQNVPAPVSDRIVYTKGPGNLVGVNGKEVESFLIVPTVDVPVPTSATYDISEAEVSILFSEPVFINTATKSDFDAVATPFTLTVQGVTDGEPNEIILPISINGPGDLPDRVEYSGKVDGIEDAAGNDVPFFIIGLDTVP